MIAPQVTSTGYQGLSFQERRSAFIARMRELATDLANVDFDAARPEGQLVDGVIQLAQDVDDGMAMHATGLDPDRAGTDAMMLVIAALRGTRPRDATKGRVTLTLTMQASKNLPTGTVKFAVLNQPDNVWVSAEPAVSTTAGDYDVLFEAVLPGRYIALAGTITFPVAATGVDAATNDLDARAGRNADTPAQTLYRSEALMYARQGSTTAAIRAECLAVEGVQQAACTEDKIGHSISVTVYDGDPHGALESEIAEAIYLHAPAGITQLGSVSYTGTLAATQVWTWGTLLRHYVVADVTGDVDATQIKLALIAAMPTLFASTTIWARLVTACLEAGATDVVLGLGTSPAPVGTSNITAGATQIPSLESADIAVT